MELSDLLGKPIDQLSTEELISSMNQLRRLGIARIESATDETPKPKKTKVIKSNADKRAENLLDSLSEEQLLQLTKLLGGA